MPISPSRLAASDAEFAGDDALDGLPARGPAPIDKAGFAARIRLAGFGQGVRLAALYGACFATIGVSMPFFPVWLGSRGLDASTIGILLSMQILLRIVVTTPLMGLLDRGVSARRLLLVGGGTVAVIYAAFLAAPGPLAIVLLVALLAIANAPWVPTCDLVAIDAVRREPRLDYGRMRLWGSISFLALNLAGGAVLWATGPDAVMWLLLALALASVAVVRLALPQQLNVTAVDTAWPKGRAVRLPRSLVCVLAASAAIHASHGALYGFGSLHWRAQGFSDAVIGALWAFSVAAEIVIFACFGRAVGRQGAAFRFMAIGAAGAIARFALMALAPGVATTFVLQGLHAFSFGATHIGTMAALARLAPEGSRGRAQGLLATAGAAGMAVSMTVSGLVFRSAGAGVFAMMVPVAAAGFLLALFGVRALALQPHRDGEGG
jgi:PPP family 3-phenylpropionic acid transporter